MNFISGFFYTLASVFNYKQTTMKITLTLPVFRFPVPVLIQHGNKTVTLLARDAAELAAYGITDADSIAIKNQTQALTDFPTDAEYEGIVINKTTIKDGLADQINVDIRSKMVRVNDAFGESSGVYHRFGTKGMHEMTDLELSQCARRVVRMCNLYLNDLVAKGLTQAMIDHLSQLITDFDKAFGEKEDAVMNREIATNDRNALANDLYAKISRICDFGKDYWSSRNEAKYNDYVIYDTPSEGKEPEVPENPPA
jgi:hypothetical protein